MSAGSAHHSAALFLDRHSPRRTAVAALGHTRLQNLYPLRIVESERARIRLGQRTDKPFQILRRPPPVERAILLRSLVAEGSFSLVLRPPGGGAGLQRIQRLRQHTRDQFHPSQHQLCAGIGGADRQ
ncbi:Uncharacterised protein [Mycobacteroides abscessus subsp. abscessus]|nr:Uncharacterised protein [Mycobacteroides abscessus subsp. abscessus]